MEIISTSKLVKAIAEKSKGTDTPISQKDIAQVLTLLKETVGEELAKGNKVKLTSFVSFETFYRVPRKGYNVAKGKPMQIPGSVAVVARVGKDLKDAKNEMTKAVVDEIKKASKK